MFLQDLIAEFFFARSIFQPKTITSQRLTSNLVICLVTCTTTILAVHTARAESKGSQFANGPKTIASQERVSVTIDREVSAGKSFIVLRINVPTDSKVNAFALSNPSRLVVDFEGTSIKKSDNFTAPDNKVIQQVRLGAHPQKLRVVVDLKQPQVPEYDWKGGKRHAVIKFLEGTSDKTLDTASITPSIAPASTSPAVTSKTEPVTTQITTPALTISIGTAPAALSTPLAQSIPTLAPTPTLTATLTATPTISPLPAKSSQETLGDMDLIAPRQAPADNTGVANAGLAPILTEAEEAKREEAEVLGDLEAGRNARQAGRVQTSFTIKGYKFEHLSDKSPILKIALNKPRASAQISKVDPETYKIEIKDCGVANEDLELPQFPPHDFVGFVMVVSETVGRNVEVTVSVEEGVVLGTSVQDNEIWVKKP